MFTEGGLKLPAGDVYQMPLRKNGLFRIFLTGFFVLILCQLTPPVFAQDETGVPSQEAPVTDARAAEREIIMGESPVIEPVNPTSVWNIFRIILTLAVVAAAIYGMVFLMKRAGKGKIEKDPYLKILARTQLGVNRSAYVLSVGTQAWLVGAAENGVNLIAEIGDKEILDGMLLDESQNISRSSFGNKLDFKALLGRLGVKVDAAAPGPENIRERSERLKGL